MKKLLFILLISIQAQAQDLYKDYEFYVQKTQGESIYKAINNMVANDASDATHLEKFHKHSKMVLSRKNVDKITKVVTGGEFGGFCGYAIKEGYYYKSNPKYYIVEAGDTIYFANAFTKLKWEYDPVSRNKAEKNWSNLKQ